LEDYSLIQNDCKSTCNSLLILNNIALLS